ncbi:MAG: prolyl oligopeptidase family protein [Verrucomicrobiia bacterium]
MNPSALILTALFSAGVCADPPKYPPSRTVPQVDVYHGTEVADPYRWLESSSDPEVKAWVDAQNAVARPFLEAIPARKRLIERFTELWNYERYEAPVEEGGRYFFRKNDGLQNQDVLYVMEDWNGTARVLIDPNRFSDDGTVALSSFTPSPDGRLVAYSIQDGGSDWRTWKVRSVDSGEDIRDVIEFTKFTNIAWSRDSKGFYYSRYPVDEKTGKADDHKPVAVWHHRIGEHQTDDPLVYDLGHPTRTPYPIVTEDGRFLLFHIAYGYEKNALHVVPLAPGRAVPEGRPVKFLDAWDALYSFLGNKGSVFYIKTTLNAPRSRIVAIDLQHPDQKDWKTVIPEAAESLDQASYVGGKLIAQYLKDAQSAVRIVNPDGTLSREISLPGVGTVSGFNGHGDRPETFYMFTSFTTPPILYRYDVDSDRTEVFRRTRVPADLKPYETRQIFFKSKDGTRVPMFIVSKKGLALDGTHPTLLYGYGGYGISITPTYIPALVVWLEMGGVYASANLRGGGEYGEPWHLAGTRLQKQNVFDDFIAAAEYLVRAGYTEPKRLAIYGRSNGGLLVGAVLNQRPELFGAALPGVGVMDMLRYHTASANARQWSSDYGLSENPEEFKALHAYSPYHNIKPSTCYPPTLVTTADRDDRVVPWHSFKYAARLQQAQSCDHPILIRIETRAGHGAGKPTWMQIEDRADQWAFLAWALKLEF